MKMFILFCSILLFIHCAPVNLSLKPEYENSDFRPYSCAIVALGDITVEYRGNVENEFGKGDQNELIKKYFLKKFPSYLKANALFSEVYLDSCITNYSPDTFTIPGGFSMHKYHVPAGGTILNFVRGIPDYVFFLENLQISSIPEVDVISLNVIPIAIPYKPVTYKTQLLLWDNRKGMIAGQGYVRASKSTGVSVTSETWHLATDTFAVEIIKNTRLQYPRVDKIDIQSIDCNQVPEECGTIFWNRSNEHSLVLVQNKTKSMAYLKINGELFALKRDMIPENDTTKKRTLYAGETIIENYEYKYARIKLITFVDSRCKEAADSKKYDRYSTTMYLTFAKKRITYYLKGKRACEDSSPGNTNNL